MKVPLLACVEVVELVTDWMEGALDDDLRTELEEHLVICADCSTFARQVRLTRESLASLGPGEVPVALRDRLLALYPQWTRQEGP
ncbi:MAG TPA: zf-HC2 domain-containing protein [Acidimicrobiales bacterium]|nr:zf-HC2 domain-containing protein [Acidimicrobiales bacterium]